MYGHLDAAQVLKDKFFVRMLNILDFGRNIAEITTKVALHIKSHKYMFSRQSIISLSSPL